jgi:hypothetical protein
LYRTHALSDIIVQCGIFWVITPCSLVDGYINFGRDHCSPPYFSIEPRTIG